LNIKLTVTELELLSSAIQTWIDDLSELDRNNDGLEEHQIYRQLILRMILRRIDRKIADKKGVQGSFNMQYPPLEIWTINNCWRDEECEVFIGIMRGILSKFIAFEAKNVKLIVS